MPRSIHAKRLAAPRARPLAGAALVSVALAVAGCAGSSMSAGVAHLSSGKGASSATEGRGSSLEGPATPEQAALAYAKCMRSNGVPDFPDPTAGGGFLFHARAGIVNSPLFKTAQAKCHKLLPAGPGSGPPPSAQTLAHFLKVAQCMREHGVQDFPDPRTSVPPNPFGSGGAGVISDIEGVILVFPSAIDQRAPTFQRAAAACAFPLHNH
ncbi:MAG TPA: hypothetical protein VK778_02310 [Solirubrobacteraceae bacterium]|jgi:hypothetical protein|nr:hypothetical protein [Solirubrobacteraceae bacterium]